MHKHAGLMVALRAFLIYFQQKLAFLLHANFPQCYARMVKMETQIIWKFLNDGVMHSYGR
jgi:hypothetical protein